MKRRTVNIPLLILAALLMWRSIGIQRNAERVDRNAARLDELDRQITALEKNIAAMDGSGTPGATIPIAPTSNPRPN